MSDTLRLRSGKQIAKTKTASNDSKQRIRSKSFTTAHEYTNARQTKHSAKQRNHNSVSNGQQALSNGVHSLLSDTNAELNRRLSVSPECDVKTIVLWRRPLVTIYYAIRESIGIIARLVQWTLLYTRSCVCVCLLALALLALSRVDGPHQRFIAVLRSQLLWSLYWCGLGILSSVGFGTGLHTFLLYLGPHIASVTLAAYECESLDFPSPPYPDQIICPDSDAAVTQASAAISVWSIMAKVRLEAFMWGAGTALGELPPYFVARAHRLSGEEEEDLDPELAQEISGDGEMVNIAAQQSLYKRLRARMIRLVTKVGFFGILACASIPNPLFDLAGITCGYSLVPFWTFFGATLIGKAVIKMHIQKLFVIVAFNENYVELFVEKSRNIPYIGEFLHEPLREFLVKQKKSLHSGSQSIREVSWLQTIFEWIVIGMITYFLVSIINSMAQNYQKRVIKEHEDSLAKERRRSSAVSNHANSNLTVKSKG